MARVMPFKHSVPGVGHSVEVAVGQPLDISNITCRCNQRGHDQQQVWRDIAAALRDAVLQLEPQVPPNPNQVEERPEVAQWEANYQAKRQRRRQQQLPQQPEAALEEQHGPEMVLARQPGVGGLPGVVQEAGPMQVELPKEQHQGCGFHDGGMPEQYYCSTMSWVTNNRTGGYGAQSLEPDKRATALSTETRVMTPP
eukprot:GHUV01029767.1.p2 GENE.GHUV01029767.1~~GHUV01029767.1.p2  ORF type:complete len:197 (+),score=63.15 GHUV01029767.1:595-1185(+)